MKEDFSKIKVNLHITKCGISGPPGTGKTHIKALLLNDSPPSQRLSTALSTRAEEVTNSHLVNAKVMSGGHFQWTVLKKDHWTRLLANTIYNSSDFYQDKDVGPITDWEYNDLSSSTYKFLMKMCREKKLKRQRNTINNAHLMYIIDTGGQPQFQEILPNFVRCSVNFLVHDLSQDLNDYPKFEYVIDGKSYTAPECLRASNLSIIEQSVRSISSSVQSEKIEHTSPTIAILGTFQDKFIEEKCGGNLDRQRELLQKRSKSIEEKIQSYVGKSVRKCTLLKPPHDHHIIFPFDASERNWKDKVSAMDTLKNEVHEYSKKVKCLEVPLSYFVFLQNLMDFSKKHNKSYLNKEESNKVAQDSYISLNRNDVEEALCLFSDVNLILYFPDSTMLSNIVFVDPSFLYDRFTEIIAVSFQSSDSTSSNDFCFTGIFTSSHLDRLQSLKFKDHPKSKENHTKFTQEMFFSLLQDLFIIAELDKDRYFMPCVLQLEDSNSLSQEAVQQTENIQQHMDDNGVSGPLIISFGDKISPRGLFCAMVAKLSSNFGWRLNENENAVRRRNMIEFCVYSDFTQCGISGFPLGTALLCDKLTHLEVFTTCEKIHCSDIRKAILLSLYKAGYSLKYNFTVIDTHTGFYCKICPGDAKHHTIVSQKKDSLEWQEKCSVHTRKRAVLLNNERVGWFKSPPLGKFYTQYYYSNHGLAIAS